MKVLVADKLPPSGISGLEAAGYDVLNEPGLADGALVERVRETGAQVLVVRSTKVPRPVLEAGNLGLVIRAGAGVNTIDVEAASELGIYVANCPGKNAIAVAELAFGLALALDRRLVDCTQELRAGRWDKKGFGKARGLYGRTLGVIGTGEIGRQVARRGKAFGMRVIAWSRSLTPEKAAEWRLERRERPEDVAREADVVSVHVAQTGETKGFLGERFFAAMRPGTLFVNTARGGVVDPDALRKAITDGGVRAGLDVWSQQPAEAQGAFEDPLGQLEGVYGTHHIGASTDQAQDAVADEAVRIARLYREQGEVPNCVNVCAKSPAACALVVRHLDRVGVLAHVLEQLKGAETNVQEMENVIFEGAKAACATIRVDREPAAELLDRLRGHEHVLSITVAR